LLSLISTESVQESTEKLPLHVVMTSLYIQDQVQRESFFFQGPCFYGQRRLCLALCILSSLYGIGKFFSDKSDYRTYYDTDTELMIVNFYRYKPLYRLQNRTYSDTDIELTIV
jgi:hypothetical protein